MNKGLLFFIIIPVFLMTVIIIAMPLYCLWVIKNGGKRVFPLVRKKQIVSKWIAPFVCYILVLLPFFVDLGKFGVIIPYCAVIGLYIVIKESTFAPISGVYEHLLINGSTVLKFKDIAKLPDEPKGNNIEVLTKTNHKVQLVFDNANEAVEVLNSIKDQMK